MDAALSCGGRAYTLSLRRGVSSNETGNHDKLDNRKHALYDDWRAFRHRTEEGQWDTRRIETCVTFGVLSEIIHEWTEMRSWNGTVFGHRRWVSTASVQELLPPHGKSSPGVDLCNIFFVSFATDHLVS